MNLSFKRILSIDAGPFWQFVKYGLVGVMSTAIQALVFYVLASTCLKCLSPDDWAVKYLSLPSMSFTGEEVWYASRGTLASVATVVGFIAANIFCWIMNRAFVFKPGRHRLYVEFAMFFVTAATATALALAVMKCLIDSFGMMTSLAVAIEIVISFSVNFFARKFFIFKG